MDSFRLDFVGAGPQRTGTSWLHALLLCHPQLCLPKDVKEVMFFDRHYHQGLDWYTSHFSHRSGEQRCGEVSPTYFDVEATPGRIRRLNPDCNIIITLRNPVSRAWSSYRHHIGKGRVQGTFEEAVRQNPQIVESGRYARHIPRWLDTFKSGQVLFILLEDIETQPEVVFKTTCSFLGIDEIAMPAVAHERFSLASVPRFPWLARIVSQGATWLRARRLHRINELGKALGLRRVYSGGKDQMITFTSDMQRRLLEIYAGDIAFVESLLARDLSSWRQMTGAELK